ncbi:hypothetical protein ES702_05508 [subsurface metagenome]
MSRVHLISSTCTSSHDHKNQRHASLSCFGSYIFGEEQHSQYVQLDHHLHVVVVASLLCEAPRLLVETIPGVSSSHNTL